MGRLIGGVVGGLIVWLAVATVLNLGLRHGWHDYAAVEKAMTFTVPMMLARLSESALSSLASGYVTGRIARGGWAPLLAGTILLLLFAPVHYGLWSRFPIWYHLTFLVSLPVLSAIGGRFGVARTQTA